MDNFTLAYLKYLVQSWETDAITADELARELRKVVNEEQAIYVRLICQNTFAKGLPQS